MKRIIIIIAIWILSIQPFLFVSAESTEELKAAFLKNNDLWIKVDNKEIRITNGEFIRFPKWSFDGNWIAYIRGSKADEGPLYQGDLCLYHLKSQRHFKVFSNVNTNFQWSPNQNKLGFQSDQALKLINVSSINKPQQIASGIINFSWLPDGIGFLTSSKAGEGVFSDILLTKIALNNNNQYQPEHFYTIKVGENEYFYGTSQFKWSFDHNWIAFQLIPTASFSADSNTIAVLSSDGRRFHKIDEMLSYEEWFQWAPSHNFLAYIEGSNRVSTINKKLKIKKMPDSSGNIYTPKGFVDRDLTWVTNNEILVSRSAESDLVDVSERPLPSIYHINLETKEQSKITSPSAGEGDFQPISINNGKSLVWIRTNREQASVLIADLNNLKQKSWIEKIDVGPWYYEYWNWDGVFSLYQS
ncbi:MAG TPA: translocation protein TolB [Bacillus bacterium]|nr:translocation protein TolB [Bacillus sp. (in: firmicutes)]